METDEQVQRADSDQAVYSDLWRSWSQQLPASPDHIADLKAWQLAVRRHCETEAIVTSYRKYLSQDYSFFALPSTNSDPLQLTLHVCTLPHLVFTAFSLTCILTDFVH